MSDDNTTLAVNTTTAFETAKVSLLRLQNNGTTVAHVDKDGKLHIDDPTLAGVVEVYRERDRYKAALESMANNETSDWWWYVGIARRALGGGE